MSAAADLVITGIGRLVTMTPQRAVLTGAAVAVGAGRILAVGAEAGVLDAHPAARRFDARGGWVTPGFVNAHQHLTGDRLARASIPDDLAPGVPVFSWALPLHAAHRPEDDNLSATLAALEAVGNGITCVIEAGTVAHPDAVVAGVEAVGMRASISRWGWDVDEGPFAGPATEVVARAEELLDRYPPDGDGLVQGWVALVGHDLMSDDLVCAATELARRRGARITYHVSPTDADPRSYLGRTGQRPVVHLAALGVLAPNLLLAHALHLDDAELELLLLHDVAVAACPCAQRTRRWMVRAARATSPCPAG